MLDEPLSALDAKIRVSLREEIRQIQRQLGITTVFVTHDQEEALSISDRIVVMNAGKADQIGARARSTNRPTTRFVANFVGTLNVIQATLVNGGAGTVKIGEELLTLPQPVTGKADGSLISIAFRPEAAMLAVRLRDRRCCPARFSSSNFLGSVLRTKVDLGGNIISFDMFNQPSAVLPKAGETVSLALQQDGLMVLGD